MKKVLSAFLALLLVVSCVFSVTIVPVSAGSSASEAENWQVYLNGTHTAVDGYDTNFGKPNSGWNSVKDNTDSAFN